MDQAVEAHTERVHDHVAALLPAAEPCLGIAETVSEFDPPTELMCRQCQIISK
jgi:hypothetical protein